MKQSSRRILFSFLAVIFLLAACAPVPPATQDPALIQQVIEQSVALTLAAENAQVKDQQLIEQAVALTVIAQNAQATEQQASLTVMTPSPNAESVAPTNGQDSITPTAETVELPGGSNSTDSESDTGNDTTSTLNPDAPVIKDIDPPEGPTRGGTVVTITGENFILGKQGEAQEPTKFFFGENQATDVICEAEIKCTARTPQGVDGVVLVRAENGEIESQHIEGNVYDGFKYNAPPKYGCGVLTTTPKNLSIFGSGEGFVIKWIVQNTGESTWPAGIDVKYSGGVNMTNRTFEQIPMALKPGESYMIQLDAVAPTNPSKYYMSWKVEGMGCDAYVAIVVE